MGAEVVTGDVTDQAAVEGAVDGVQVVYHLAGRLFAPGVQPGAYKRVHVDGTAVLLGCCARARKVTRFVHCSTTGVLGATGHRPAPEDAPIRPGNAYEATKAESEQLVRIACSNGFPAVIARPGLVYGPGDLHLVPFFASVLRRRFRPIGRNPVWLHPIYIDDLTEALLTCGWSERALGECFNLAGRQPVTLAELARAVGLAGGVRPTSGFIPLYVARTAAKVGDLLPPGLRATAPLTTSRLDFLTHSRVYDVTKAARVLGFTAATDLADGMAKTFAWYGSNGYLPRSASSERLPLPVTSMSTGPSTCGKNARKRTWPATVTASRCPHDQLISDNHSYTRISEIQVAIRI
jgi:nucleoside-diphosphate-sugar epimerase